ILLLVKFSAGVFVSIVWSLFSLWGPGAWSSLDKPWSGSSLV
ncbi:21292_t:CDS:1, partial [Dentiscutata erythropus]